MSPTASGRPWATEAGGALEPHWYLSLALLAGIALLQTTLAPRITWLGAKPDLMLVTVVCWGLLRGPAASLPWAFVGGLMLDLLSGAPFGATALVLMLTNYLSTVGETSLLRFSFLLPVTVVAVASLVYNGLFLGLLWVLGRPVAWQAALLHVMLPAMLINTLIMPLVYFPLRRWHRRVAGPSLGW